MEKRRERLHGFLPSCVSGRCCCCCSVAPHFLSDRSCGTFHWEGWEEAPSVRELRARQTPEKTEASPSCFVIYNELGFPSARPGHLWRRSNTPDRIKSSAPVTRHTEYQYAKNNLSSFSMAGFSRYRAPGHKCKMPPPSKQCSTWLALDIFRV